MSRVIYVELDGTFVEQGTMKPVEAVVKRIKAALSMGDEVKILMADLGRSKNLPVVEELDALCMKHFGSYLDLRKSIEGDMTEFWSHRAVQLEKNTGRRLVPLKSFGG